MRNLTQRAQSTQRRRRRRRRRKEKRIKKQREKEREKEGKKERRKEGKKEKNRDLTQRTRRAQGRSRGEEEFCWRVARGWMARGRRAARVWRRRRGLLAPWDRWEIAGGNPRKCGELRLACRSGDTRWPA